jgi:hypothetical protein
MHIVWKVKNLAFYKHVCMISIFLIQFKKPTWPQYTYFPITIKYQYGLNTDLTLLKKLIFLF